MKKFYIVILISIITYLVPTTAKASNIDTLTSKTDFVKQNEPIKLASSTTSQEEIISSQTDALGISTFLSDSEKYTKDTFGNIDMSELFKQSLSGNIDNNTIMNIVFSLLGDNVKTALTTIASVMVVVIIHSILKAISENLGNENVSKIAYYIEYILNNNLGNGELFKYYNRNETGSSKLDRICKYAYTTNDYSHDNNWKCGVFGNASANFTITYNVY